MDKKILNKLIKFYKENGYLNIIVGGQEGTGRSTLAIQILKKVAKELGLDYTLENIQHRLDEDKLKLINLFDDQILNSQTLLTDDVLKENINIISLVYESKTFNSDLKYFGFKTYMNFKEGLYFERGFYKFADAKEIFKFEELVDEEQQALYKRRKEEIERWITRDPNSKEIEIGLYKNKVSGEYDVMIDRINNTHKVHNGEFEKVKSFIYFGE